jgi:hypothetical protein
VTALLRGLLHALLYVVMTLGLGAWLFAPAVGSESTASAPPKTWGGATRLVVA